MSIMEGPDQYRGWFQSSLLIGVGTRGRAPYKQVVTHGWTLDEKGAPMSKSLGNAMYPKEICEKWGADLLRVWVASQDFTQDVRISEAMMTQLAEAYRKIRNTFRFALSNLFDFEPATRHRARCGHVGNGRLDASPHRSARPPMQRVVRGIRISSRLSCDSRFLHRRSSAFYFDVLKDRLYTFAPNNRGRRSAQTAIYHIARALVRLIAPILVFTSEEVWKYLPRGASAQPSVHMASFPSPEPFEKAFDDARAKDWDRLLAVREEVLKALEPLRAAKTISAGLEARVTLTAKERTCGAAAKTRRQPSRLFHRSQVG